MAPAESPVGRVLDPSFADDLTLVTGTSAGKALSVSRLSHAFLLRLIDGLAGIPRSGDCLILS
jgi:hypothetical protein